MAPLDPVSWFHGKISERGINRIVRLIMTLICTVFLVRRLMEYHLYYFKPLWFVETLIYIILIAAFLTRIDPQVRSKGFTEIVIPLVGSAFPFLLLFTPPSPWIIGEPLLLRGTFAAMTGTTALTIWALFYLRRSFSLTVEVRALVREGPYRWIRHPMYLGEILTAGAVSFWRFSPQNLVFFVGFVSIQLFRAWIEEKKLSEYLGKDYRIFASSRWWFLPTQDPVEK